MSAIHKWRGIKLQKLARIMEMSFAICSKVWSPVLLESALLALTPNIGWTGKCDLFGYFKSLSKGRVYNMKKKIYICDYQDPHPVGSIEVRNPVPDQRKTGHSRLKPQFKWTVQRVQFSIYILRITEHIITFYNNYMQP